MNTTARFFVTIAAIGIPILAAVNLHGDLYSWWVAGAATLGTVSMMVGAGGEAISLLGTVAGIVLLIVSVAR